MKAKFQCDICKQLYDTETECLDCENGHAETVPCEYESSNGTVDAICSILDREGTLELTFTWQLSESKIANRLFKIDSSKLSIDVASEASGGETECVT